MRKATILTLLLVIGLCLSTEAEVIKLRDGSELRGKIIEKKQMEVRVELDGIEISIAGDEIVSIDGEEHKVDAEAMLQEMLDAVVPGDAEGLYEVAVWCSRRNMEEKAGELLKEVLQINPGHAGANKAVGKVFRDGRWQTPQELRAQGYVFLKGEWLTKDQANAAKGMVKHLGVWVSEEDRDELLGRTFSRYNGPFRTHRVCELRRECMRLDLFNRLNLSRSDMEELFPVFLEAEDVRQEWLRKRHEINAQAEHGFLGLREAIMLGVIVSFDVPKEISEARVPATDAAGKIQLSERGYYEMMGNIVPKAINLLSNKQQWTAIHSYCRSCHGSREGCSECSRCHTGQGGLPAGVRPNQAGMQTLLEARAMSASEFAKKKDKLVDRFVKPIEEAKSKAELREKQKHERMSVAMAFDKARGMSDTEFEKQKFILAAQLGARNEMDRALIEMRGLMREMMKFRKSKSTKNMWVDCLFDGTFYELLANKLGKGKVARLEKKRMVEAGGPMGLVEKAAMSTDTQAVFRRVCTRCHTLDRVMKARASAADWDRKVGMMTKSLPEEERKYRGAIVEYLIDLESRKE